MPLIIEQRFPLGRFHATRWKQGTFGDPYGEWPPSPYRLLRALVMRWFQYVREMGLGREEEEANRRGQLYPLLDSLSNSLPFFYLPPYSWRGPAIKQYQPTAVEWTDKQKKNAGYKKPAPTLVEDHYRLIPPEEMVFWYWEKLELPSSHISLLDNLLSRVLYFGRAESFCRMRRVEALPNGVEVNCLLNETDDGKSVPVLSPVPGQLNPESLLWATGEKEMISRPTPPGTRWYYAKLPKVPRTVPSLPPKITHPEGLRCVQFAVGGRVFPPVHLWVKLTERFRGRVIKELAMLISPESRGEYQRLDEANRRQLSMISGKDEQGKPFAGHRHAYFLLWPDESSQPTRLIVVREEPFTHNEIEAMLMASEKPVAWDYSAPKWKVRLVPIPFGAAPPQELFTSSRVWKTITPFVPPAERHRFRKGKERPGESLEQIVTRLLNGRAKPSLVEAKGEVTWVKLHETRERRQAQKKSRTPWMRPGYQLKVTFDEEVSGPLILGDSCHYGLGLFVPAR